MTCHEELHSFGIAEQPGYLLGFADRLHFSDVYMFAQLERIMTNCVEPLQSQDSSSRSQVRD